MQASMAKHSSSTATVSADGDALLSATGPPAIAAGDSVSDGTTSPGSADASLTVGSGAGSASASLATGAGSGVIWGAGGAAATMSVGSAEASWTVGAGVSGGGAS